jgi:hypothetical protein
LLELLDNVIPFFIADPELAPLGFLEDLFSWAPNTLAGACHAFTASIAF